ncbi:hypothetical protein BX666DRAFT_1958802 [Dichotomocladium elegans]|nr:hypothetical protein BX666DRAFT_1958802 [Dichotomocladium elegans]
MHYGIVGEQWSSAMNADKGEPTWWRKHSERRPRTCDQLIEFGIYAVQTFFVMGMMNLAEVESYAHAFQMGIFFFIAHVIPDVYRSHVWEARPCDLLAIKLLHGFLNTVGLTVLLQHFGSTII